MNRSSLDRGFGRCIVLKKSSTVLRKYANRTQDRIVAPMPGERCQPFGFGGWSQLRKAEESGIHLHVVIAMSVYLRGGGWLLKCKCRVWYIFLGVQEANMRELGNCQHICKQVR